MSLRTVAAWYHFADAGRDAKRGRVVAPIGRPMSRTVLWLVLGGVIVIAAGLGIAWQGKRNERAVLGQVGQVGQGVGAATLPNAPPGSPVAPAASSPAAPPAADPAAAAPALGIPTFDIARIGRDGRAVVAGKAAPGARIVLLDGGKEIARGEADARGEWVVLAQDPPLAPGQHELRVVQHVEGRAPVTSDQVVVAVVPEPEPGTAGAPAGRDETLVMIAPPVGSPTVVQAPSPSGTPRSGDLVLSTVDYDEHGAITVTGQAAPGTVVRVYVDDRLAAEGTAAADGRWKLVPAEPVAAGKHTLRLDRIAGDGKPVARLEMPFDRVEVPPGTPDSRRLVVVRGDNLWNIARAHYGTGFHHTVIFGANKEQIRNPDLIYPGQVFSLPKVN